MIEQEFFKAFGIEKRWKYFVKHIGKTYYCDKQGILENISCFVDFKNAKVYKVVKHYPEITAEILLKIICILNDFEGIDVKATTPEKLKEELLKQCIEPFEYPIAFEEHYEIDKLYQQVRSLFKEGE